MKLAGARAMLLPSGDAMVVGGRSECGESSDRTFLGEPPVYIPRWVSKYIWGFTWFQKPWYWCFRVLYFRVSAGDRSVLGFPLGSAETSQLRGAPRNLRVLCREFELVARARS